MTEDVRFHSQYWSNVETAVGCRRSISSEILGHAGWSTGGTGSRSGGVLARRSSPRSRPLGSNDGRTRPPVRRFSSRIGVVMVFHRDRSPRSHERVETGHIICGELLEGRRRVGARPEQQSPVAASGFDLVAAVRTRGRAPHEDDPRRDLLDAWMIRGESAFRHCCHRRERRGLPP